MCKKYLRIWIIAAVGGGLFSLIHLPLPWMLGPILTVAIIKRVYSLQFQTIIGLAIRIRRIALVVLGYTLGSAFTIQTGQYIVANFSSLMGLTVLTIGICLLGGLAAGRIFGIDIVSSILGSTPSGMMQIVSVNKKVKGTNTSAIIMMQVIRTITVVVLVPFLVLQGFVYPAPTINHTSAQVLSDEFPMFLLFASVIAAAIYLAELLKITGSFIFAPIITTAVMVVAGIQAPPLPALILLITQVGFGIPIGMIINLKNFKNWKKITAFSLVSGVIVILALLGISYLYSKYFAADFVTTFISIAPGGIFEMGLVAMAVHANPATVVSCQLFRLLFVMVVVMPNIHRWLVYYTKDTAGE